MVFENANIWPKLTDLAQREELRRTSICLLVGPGPDRPGRDRVDIGEGNNLLKRLI